MDFPPDENKDLDNTRDIELAFARDRLNYYRDVVKQAGIGFGTITRMPKSQPAFAGKFLHANDYLVDLLGMPEKKPEDSSAAVYLRRFIQNADEVVPQINEILKMGNGIEEFVFRSKTDRVCCLTLRPATYLNTSVYCLEIRDLTKEMQVDHLQREVELLHMLTGALGHEIKTPLSAIQTNLDLLNMLNKFDGKSAPKVENISYLVSRTSQMIDRILAFTKLYRGNVKLETAPINPGLIFEQMTKLYQHSALKNEIELTFKSEVQDNVQIRSDHDWVSQALSIVIENSLKYTESGGCSNISVERLNNTYKFTVSDNGKGIDPANIENIFEFMNRGNGVENTNGVGLGLNFAKTIIALLGGSIYADSPGPGEGSTFTIIIPDLNANESETKVEM